MDLPGKYIMVDGLEFHPRVEGIQKLPVAGYQYIAAPTRGDDNATVLTDGKVDEQAQAVWREYADLPNICFDLGGMFLVDNIKVEAIAVPSQNIQRLYGVRQRDGEKWDLVGVLQSEAFRQKTHQVVEKPGAGRGGRYFRLEFQRPRQDFPLGWGRSPSSASLPRKRRWRNPSRPHYDVGPAVAEGR